MGKPLREYNTLKTFEKLAGHMGLNELAPQGTLHPVGRRDLIKDLLAHANNSFLGSRKRFPDSQQIQPCPGWIFSPVGQELTHTAETRQFY